MGVTAAVLDLDTWTAERAIGTNVPADFMNAVQTAEANELSGIWEEDASIGTPKTCYVLKPDTALSPVNPALRILFCGDTVGGPANNRITGHSAAANRVYVGVSVFGGNGTLSADPINAAAGQVYTGGSADFSGWSVLTTGAAVTDLQFIVEATAQMMCINCKQTAGDSHHGGILGACALPADDSETNPNGSPADTQLYGVFNSGEAVIQEDFHDVAPLGNGWLSGNQTTRGAAVGYDWSSGTWIDLVRDTYSAYYDQVGQASGISPRGSLRLHEIGFVNRPSPYPFWGKLRQVYWMAPSHHKRIFSDGTARINVMGAKVQTTTRGVIGVCNFRS